LRCRYVVYWGATEPPGRSLVLPVVERLAALGEEIFLVTFDKPGDFADAAARDAVAARLTARGIRWCNLVYHKRPQHVATAYDILRGVLFCAWWGVRHRTDVVHARTYVGGIIGWLLSRILPVRYVFHNEGFWPEEQVDNEVWRPGSLSDRAARWIARRMYERAHGILVLSRRAHGIVAQNAEVARRATPIRVAPSCIDLPRFADAPRRRASSSTFRLVYVGTRGLRYLVDELLDFMRVARQVIHGTQCRIVTRADRAFLGAHLRQAGLAPTDIEIGLAPFDQIPEILAEQDAAVFILKRGLSNIACSPTKGGEYLAAGLPVATTVECGDLGLIVSETRSGVLIPKLAETRTRKLFANCSN
jgi:glycosyltransferase involved in cell wall biosynthesis